MINVINMNSINDLRNYIYSHDIKDVRSLVFCARPNENQEMREYVYIVRCKDCIHYDEPEWTCLLHESNMKPTDYCSYGEINGADRERDNH